MKLSPHPITLRQLQYALAVADARNFHKAAELCHVSQPSLSAQLAQLEDALGVRLFERDRRRVLPTPAGAEIVERARRLVVDADDLVEAAKRLGDPLAGTLRLGVIPTISPYLLPALSPRLRADFPRLSAVWVEDKTGALVLGLESGTLDAAIVALEADLGDVESEVVAVDPFVLVTPAGHPLGASGSPALPRELRGAQVLLLDDGHCFRDQALEVCSAGRADELAFRATSLSTLAQMVASGMGVTLLPRLALETERVRAVLQARSFADPAPHRTLALIWRRRSSLAPALREIAGSIRGAYPGSRSSRAGSGDGVSARRVPRRRRG